MRLWSIHPKYLDAKGLVALWRETLLAKKVLEGKTKGYKNHPQLERFKSSQNSIGLISSYLDHIFKEAQKRGYDFDKKKIGNIKSSEKIFVTTGQIEYEFLHLKRKLMTRDKYKFSENSKIKMIELNHIFKIKKGKIEFWEKV